MSNRYLEGRVTTDTGYLVIMDPGSLLGDRKLTPNLKRMVVTEEMPSGRIVDRGIMIETAVDGSYPVRLEVSPDRRKRRIVIDLPERPGAGS